MTMHRDANVLQSLADIYVILVGTTHPGNIGAAARAMKTMGLANLILVAPKTFPCAEATARASGADDILQRAKVTETLDAALTGINVAYGTTARSRHFEWPVLNPRQAAQEVATYPVGDKIAIVFGREKSGLSNDELEQCQRAIRIPASAEYSSLNLAQAVQVIAYELAFEHHLAAQPGDAPVRQSEREASAHELKGLLDHFEEAMAAVGYLDPDEPKHLRRRLMRMFARARLVKSEVQIFRGFLAKITRP